MRKTSQPSLWAIASRGADGLGCAGFHLRSLAALLHSIELATQQAHPDQARINALFRLADYLVDGWIENAEGDAADLAEIAASVRTETGRKPAMQEETGHA